jgi:predicted transcriptional regulator
MPDVLTFRPRRPKQDRPVAVRLDTALVERVDGLAARLRTTRSAIVRRLLLDLLAQDAEERGGARQHAA